MNKIGLGSVMKEYKYCETFLSKKLTLDENSFHRRTIKNMSKSKSHIDFISSYTVSLRTRIHNRELCRIFFFGPNCSNTLHDKGFKNKKKCQTLRKVDKK